MTNSLLIFVLIMGAFFVTFVAGLLLGCWARTRARVCRWL